MSIISSKNIISKLAFAISGGALEEDMKKLRRFLNQKSAEHGSVISRTMIHNWTTQSGVPTQDKAFTFIYDVIREFRQNKALFDELSNDRKKVSGQIRRFCLDRKKTEKRSNAIYGKPGGSIILDQSRIFPVASIADELPYYPGIYNIYRKRFGNAGDEDISVEVCRISSINNQLYATWWFLIDDNRLDRFEGVVLFVGTNVWIIAHNPSLSGRMRALCVDRTGWGRTEQFVHTGVMLSSTPDFRLPTPASCRVFMERVKKPSKRDELRKFVYHTNSQNINHPQKDAIAKFINNNGGELVLSADIRAMNSFQDSG